MLARFAMDHNFPQPLVAALAPYFPEADLVALQTIDPRLPRLDDWELLLALHQDARGWAGLITRDSSMLKLPRELAVLMQTKQALIVAEAAGHGPFKATGLVLTHLASVCSRLVPGKAQLWKLAATDKRPEDPWDEFQRVAVRQRQPHQSLYEQVKLSSAEMVANPFLRLEPHGT